jgi:pimeloyl-ACP methyl ester carboxylesterase
MATKILTCVLVPVLLCGCAHLVKISYPPEASIQPTFDQPFTTWEGQRVRVIWTPTLREEALKYLLSYDQVLLADSIRQRGLRYEYKIVGNGTPLVVHSKNPESSLKEKHYPTTGITLGVTAVKEESPGQVPLLKLYDSFDPFVVRAARGPNPIAANYTATLAVFDSHARKVAGSAFASFLRPDNPRFATGIYLIHPYDPNKIPILFIHGLLSSPLSWQNLTNDLCSDPQILEHYQPWFFLYPTGESVLDSAAQLREDLQTTRRLFDPTGTAVASRHLVVVAHSMGGLLAHTLVSDSNDGLWNVFANRPLASLSLQPAERSMLLRYFFFRHQPGIDRIIFLAVPHRGSYLAAGIVGSIGDRLMRHSRAPAATMKELVHDYPGILAPYFLRINARGGPTSLFSLAPNPLLDGLAGLPIRVPFHSIIGHLGTGAVAESSDGVVPYRSAHLEGAESEKIVSAGHDMLSNSAVVTEIKRILDENIRVRER